METFPKKHFQGNSEITKNRRAKRAEIFLRGYFPGNLAKLLEIVKLFVEMKTCFAKTLFHVPQPGINSEKYKVFERKNFIFSGMYRPGKVDNKRNKCFYRTACISILSSQAVY